MNKTEIVLAAALFVATTSAALAQGAATHVHQHRNGHVQSAPVLQQRNVALPIDGQYAAGPFWYNGSGPTSGGM
jgi:hypothetical protein